MSKRSINKKGVIRSEDKVSHGKRSQKTQQYVSKVRQLEDKLQEEKDKFRSLIEIIPAMVFIKDKHNRTIECNELYAKALDTPKQKILNRSINGLFPEADIHFDDDLEVIASGNAKYNIVNMLETSKGKLWLSTNKAPLTNKRSEIIGVIGCSLDISFQKQFEEKLRESEERYRFIFEGTQDAIVIVSPDAKILDVNRATSILSGYDRSELKGMSLADLNENLDIHSHKGFFHRILAGEYVISEAKIIRKDRTEIDTEFCGIKMMIRGNPYVHLVARDIGERKRARENLIRYQDHLEMLVEQRTAELRRINAELEREIGERKKTEKALRKRENELKGQSDHLEEVNHALKVLLEQRENDKKELEEAVLSNVKELVYPYLERMKKSRLSTKQTTLLNILESNLSNIISPFVRKLSSRFLNLTPMEIKVANLVKEGKTNDEIADLLFLSTNTILSHRYHLRSKLGLKNKKINLRIYLKSLDTSSEF